MNNKTVFVVHGRNTSARNAMFTFLRAIGLQPLEWDEAKALTSKGNPYVGDILSKAFSVAQAILVVFTPDDEAKLRDMFITDIDEEHDRKLTPQARQT